MLDFRSDTVTRPTPGMRAAMATAEVGDDVFGDDPTVHRLQDRLAELLGKEAALFVPSGTMSNQIAIRTHCRPGDELLCEANCHIYLYEQGGAAQLSGVTCHCLPGEYGVLAPEQFTGLIRGGNDHFVRTRLVSLENTSNRGGGRITPYVNIESICGWAHGNGLVTHLDGARLFNAVVATGIPAENWAQHFDSVNVCFSKGLGAPVGSAVAGTKDFIAQARRHRKLLGGGMRQAGILAAAALYALEHHVERLAEDHAHAQILGAHIQQVEGLQLKPAEIHTNLVIFQVDAAMGTAAQFAAQCKAHGLLVGAIGPQLIRMCTHLDVTAADAKRAGEILQKVAGAVTA